VVGTLACARTEPTSAYLPAAQGWPFACLPHPQGWPPVLLPPAAASAERASFRDTTREQGPGDGFRGPGSVRSAVVSDAREPGSGETRELATTGTPGVAVAAGKAGR
jgi:hypothetical protein